MFPDKGNGHHPGDPSLPFSPRERQVVELIALGRSNREIARALGISYLTAKVHVRHVYTKIGVTHRAAAVLWATQHWNGNDPNEKKEHSNVPMSNQGGNHVP